MRVARELKGVAPSSSTAQRLGSLGVIRYLILCRRKMMRYQEKAKEVPSHLNTPGGVLCGIWSTTTLSGPFIDILEIEGKGPGVLQWFPQPSPVLVLKDRANS